MVEYFIAAGRYKIVVHNMIEEAVDGLPVASKCAKINRPYPKHFVERRRAVRTVSRINRICDGGTVHDMSVQVG